MKLYLKTILTSIIIGMLLSGCGVDNKDTSEDKTNTSAVTQIAKLEASHNSYYGQADELGPILAMSNDYIVTSGVTWNYSTSYYNACVYVFKKNSDSDIKKIAKLKPSETEASESGYFGSSVAINGNYIVVGASNYYAPLHGNNAVYIFKINSDSDVRQIVKIQVEDEIRNSFGASVAISGDYIVVGAYDDDTAAYKASGAYVFKRNSDANVTQIAKIYSDDIEHGDAFGNSVSIDGNYIVIGALYEDTAAPYAGSAYLFKINSDTNVSQIAKIQAEDANLNEYFGKSVSISSDYIAIGAIGDERHYENSGSAYIFKRNSDDNVTQIAKIKANYTDEHKSFGTSISINNEYIVVGAHSENTTAIDAGSAYVFKRHSDTNVTQIAKISADNAESHDHFGRSVTTSGNYILIGSSSTIQYLFKIDVNQTK